MVSGLVPSTAGLSSALVAVAHRLKFDRLAQWLVTHAALKTHWTVSRNIAIRALELTPWLSGDDFLETQQIATPVPEVDGALPALAREGFAARDLKRLFDLLVIFRIADFSELGCSRYFDPKSPWYNVFYGSYGIRSYKLDGAAWGFDAQGHPKMEEILEVPFVDYNMLTAGELGCPAEKMCFQLKTPPTPRLEGRWYAADCEVTVPSGLHRLDDARSPNLSYYAAFGVPSVEYSNGHASYEPVAMKGTMHFRQVAPRITVVWGALCPATEAGQTLHQRIVNAMRPHYL